MDQFRVLLLGTIAREEFLSGIAENVCILFGNVDVFLFDIIPVGMTLFGDPGRLLEQTFGFLQRFQRLLFAQ